MRMHSNSRACPHCKITWRYHLQKSNNSNEGNPQLFYESQTWRSLEQALTTGSLQQAGGHDLLLRDLKNLFLVSFKILFEAITEAKPCFSVDYILAQFFDPFSIV